MKTLWMLGALAIATSAWGQVGPPPPQEFHIAVITNPEQARPATPGDYLSVYPPAARKAHVSGKATVRCNVSAHGEINGCVVKAEDPLGQGFGEAAIKLVTRIGAKPGTRDGEPSDGAFTNYLNFTAP